jgi:hypothetical protein
MSDKNLSKNPKTSQGKSYAQGMSDFFGKDVSSSTPVQNYEKAIVEKRVGRHLKKNKNPRV